MVYCWCIHLHPHCHDFCFSRLPGRLWAWRLHLAILAIQKSGKQPLGSTVTVTRSTQTWTFFWTGLAAGPQILDLNFTAVKQEPRPRHRCEKSGCCQPHSPQRHSEQEPFKIKSKGLLIEMEVKRSVRITTARIITVAVPGQIGKPWKTCWSFILSRYPGKQIAGSVWLSWHQLTLKEPTVVHPIWSFPACGSEALRKSPDRKFCGSSGWQGWAWNTLTWTHQPCTINHDKHYDLTWHNFFKLSLPKGKYYQIFWGTMASVLDVRNSSAKALSAQIISNPVLRWVIFAWKIMNEMAWSTNDKHIDLV